MSSPIIFYLVAGVLVAAAVYRSLRRRSVPRRSSVEADAKVRSGEALFLDVRTVSEHGADHIKGALHIPLHTLKRRAKELQKHPGREIICYCRNGNRSLSAAVILRRRGLNASSLDGGIDEWNYYRHTRG
jgi:rhodanese-related sulfurtransferase